MSHHKRGRPKNRRSGCLLCKPWKANGAKGRAAMQPIDVRRENAIERAHAEVGRDGSRNEGEDVDHQNTEPSHAD